MRAFLPESVVTAVRRADQNRRIAVGRVTKIERRTDWQILRAFDSQRRKRFYFARIVGRLARETRRAEKQRG